MPGFPGGAQVRRQTALASPLHAANPFCRELDALFRHSLGRSCRCRKLQLDALRTFRHVAHGQHRFQYVLSYSLAAVVQPVFHTHAERSWSAGDVGLGDATIGG